MFPSHEFYRLEYEERLRKILQEQHYARMLPPRRSWFTQTINQIRMFLW